MRNIKKTAGRLLLVFVVIFLFEAMVEFIYRPYNKYSTYAVRELKDCQGKIDTLFLGTSTAYRGFSPEIFDKELGTFSFNMATASQPVLGTLKLLKDHMKRNPIKRVFLGISPAMLSSGEASTWEKEEVYDRLLSQKEKFSWMIKGCTEKEWLNMFFYSVRVNKYFDMNLIKNNISYKLSDAYRDNQAPMESYRGRGFLAKNEVYDKKGCETIVKGECTWAAEPEREKALIEIMEYCREKDVELILVYIPVTAAEINRYKDISKIHDYFKALADRYEAVFWDFNYYAGLKEEFPNSMFQDKKHLNESGGIQFSRLFLEIYRKFQKGEEIEGYFLDGCPYYENFY